MIKELMEDYIVCGFIFIMGFLIISVFCTNYYFYKEQTKPVQTYYQVDYATVMEN